MKKRYFLFVFLLLLVASCAQPTPAPEAQNNAPAQPATATAFAPLPPTATVLPSATPTSTATPTPTATPLPVVYGPDNFPEDVNPLTGLKVKDAAILNRRPLAVKVDVNFPYTRPPYGLTVADITYLYYHNGAASRMHTIFYGEDAELVGSVRSGRMLDDQLVRMYKSVFGYGSADENIRARLYNSNYSDRLVIEYAMQICPPTAANPLCRFKADYDHILLAGTEALSQWADSHGVNNSRQPLDGMYFHGAPPEGGESGEQVFTRFSSVDYQRWDYDAESNRYLLFYDNVTASGVPESYEPLTDKLNDQQITADNVVVLIVRDAYFRPPPGEIIDIFLNDGQGKAYAFRDGQAYEATWNWPNQESVLYLTNPDGSNFPFKPGKTWFVVMNDISKIQDEGEGVWKFEYLIR